jgi:RNA polymerase sigma-70 factor (ECF subfamily)
MGADVEQTLAELIREGAFDRAATLAIDSYGPEVHGFLVGVCGNPDDAAEVYAQVGEDLWSGLPSFALRSTVRTWLYVLARHAAARFRRSPWNRGARRELPAVDEAIARTRSSTQPWQRTDVKDRFAALRDGLDPDDRALLVLRVDRELSWEDVARITLGEPDLDALALRRESDRLRKRFQLIKKTLRERAREAGLLEDDDTG